MIGLFGITHQTAPVSARELFALDGDRATEWITELQRSGLIRGGIVLSTCNRMELYYDAETNCAGSLRKRLTASLCKLQAVDSSDASWFIYQEEQLAMEHLFRLSAGLESIVLGETQIVGQLKDAFRRATEHNQSTSILSRMFHKAFETAKAIRSDYLISATPLSAGSSAVRLLHSQLPDLPDRPILIVGAGQIAETIHDALSSIGATQVSLYNRTRSRAERFMERHWGISSLFTEEDLATALAKNEVLFVATSSLHPVITADLFRERRELWIADLAVPRNVSTDLEQYSEIHLYTIDDLYAQEGIELSDERSREIDQKIADAVADFSRWCDASQMREVIGVIQQTSDAILSRELDKLPHQLTDQERQLIAKYDKHLRITYATAIVSSLREITDDGQNTKYTEAIHRLFSHMLDKEQQ